MSHLDHQRARNGAGSSGMARYSLGGLFAAITLAAVYIMLVRMVGVWLIAAIVFPVASAFLHLLIDKNA